MTFSPFASVNCRYGTVMRVDCDCAWSGITRNPTNTRTRQRRMQPPRRRVHFPPIRRGTRLAIHRTHPLLERSRAMGLRDNYNYAGTTATNLRIEASADEHEGKLHFHGTVNSEDEKNQIWNAIKTIPDWPKDIMADIRVKAGAQAPAAQAAQA